MTPEQNMKNFISIWLIFMDWIYDDQYILWLKDWIWGMNELFELKIELKLKEELKR
jgi:hypothetical protein